MEFLQPGRLWTTVPLSNHIPQTVACRDDSVGLPVSRQDTGRADAANHDSEDVQGRRKGSRHPQECHAAHAAQVLSAGSAGEDFASTDGFLLTKAPCNGSLCDSLSQHVSNLTHRRSVTTQLPFAFTDQSSLRSATIGRQIAGRSVSEITTVADYFPDRQRAIRPSAPAAQPIDDDTNDIV